METEKEKKEAKVVQLIKLAVSIVILAASIFLPFYFNWQPVIPILASTITVSLALFLSLNQEFFTSSKKWVVNSHDVLGLFQTFLVVIFVIQLYSIGVFEYLLNLPSKVEVKGKVVDLDNKPIGSVKIFFFDGGKKLEFLSKGSGIIADECSLERSKVQDTIMVSYEKIGFASITREVIITNKVMDVSHRLVDTATFNLNQKTLPKVSHQ
jgi:hypothetical protein